MNLSTLKALTEKSPTPFDENELLDFDQAVSEYVLVGNQPPKAEIRSVDLRDVVGTTQSFYAGDSWGYLLRNRLKEVKAQRQLTDFAANPCYAYQDHPSKEDWHFYSLNGNLFFSGGKNRTIITRYLAHYYPDKFPNGPIIAYVGVTELKINDKSTRLMHELKFLLAFWPHLSLKVNCSSDSLFISGWNVFNSYLCEWCCLKSEDELQQFIICLRKSNKFRRLVGTGHHAFLRRGDFW